MIPYHPRQWLRLLLASRGSLSPGVPRRVLSFGLIGVIALALEKQGVHDRLPVGLHEIAGAVIALILAFRTNTAYNRFWEARTIWGAIVNASRNLTRVVQSHALQQPDEHRMYATWVVLFAHATRRWLRDESIAPEASRLLPPEQAAELASAAHPPLHAAAYLSDRIATLVRAGAFEPILATQAEQQLAVLVDKLGASERIRNTPTPLSLVLLMERFLALYLATLPFALLARAGWLTPLVTMAVAYPILMIDAVGAELDEPFGHNPNDLPLSRICKTIERNLLGTVASTPPPGDVPSYED